METEFTISTKLKFVPLSIFDGVCKMIWSNDELSFPVFKNLPTEICVLTDIQTWDGNTYILY